MNLIFNIVVNKLVPCIGDYLLSAFTDQYWAFSDIRTGKLLAKVCNYWALDIALPRFTGN